MSKSICKPNFDEISPRLKY